MIIKKGPTKYDIIHSLKSVFNKIFQKKVRILLKVLFIALIFFSGILSGLFFTGFFGTLDKPSELTRGLFDSLEIRTLASKVRPIYQGLIHENIRLPLNFVKGKLSNPEKIYIDISYENYQKLAHKREQSLELGFLFSGDDFVPAEIRHNDDNYKAGIRLKGDDLEHLEGDKWSLRIKIKGNKNLFGMKIFSIQRPETRNSLNELVFQEMLKKEDIIFLRTKFVEVVINGENKGIYILQEHFDKGLIENNNRREGPIIKFNEDLLYNDMVQKPQMPFEERYLNAYVAADIDAYQTTEIIKDEKLYKDYQQAKDLLELFRQGKLKTKDVFDINILAKYFALIEVMGGQHGVHFINVRYYFNPITSKLEPVGFDSNAGNIYWPPGFKQKLFLDKAYIPDGIFVHQFFEDEEFFEKYNKESQRMSQKSYLDNFFSQFEGEIRKNLDILHKENSFYFFNKDVYYANQEVIREYLEPFEVLQSYLQEKTENKIVLSIANIQEVPVEIEKVIYQGQVFAPKKRIIIPFRKNASLNFQEAEFVKLEDSRGTIDENSEIIVQFKILGVDQIREEPVFPWPILNKQFNDIIRNPATVDSFDFLTIDGKEIKIKKGSWSINRNLIIPEGYNVVAEGGTRLNLINNAIILSYSNLRFLGSEDNKVEIISSDGTGGVVVINAKDTSKFSYVDFENIRAPSVGFWELTGAVTFYESNVIFDHSTFKHIEAEDGLNVIHSKIVMKNTWFEDLLSDCFDGDFITGSFDQLSFKGCGNDGFDISGSKASISDMQFLKVGDKAISVGEKSELIADGIHIDESFIGIASKDKSSVIINDINIYNSEYGIVAYQKKPEFGPALVVLKNKPNFNKVINPYLLEINSEIIGIGEENSQKKVYEKLYPVKNDIEN